MSDKTNQPKRSVSRFIAIGALIGAVVSIIVYLLFPSILNSNLFFNVSFNKALGFPADYYSPTGGSIFSVGTISVYFGIIGGALGFLASLVKSLKKTAN